MKLVVQVCGADESAAARTKPATDLMEVESPVITEKTVRSIADRLRAGMAHVTVEAPVLSHAGQTATIKLQGPGTYQDIRSRVTAIRQIVNSALHEAGVEVPQHRT